MTPLKVPQNILPYYGVSVKSPFRKAKMQIEQIKCLNDILRYGDETLKIVEAIAEHDFCFLRLIVMISA